MGEMSSMAERNRTVEPRARVIIDNDFAGDPDDLFQLAHHVLSPTTTIPFVISSHLYPTDEPRGRQAARGAEIARELLHLMKVDVPVLSGTEFALEDVGVPRPSAASEAIVAEAMRDDTDLPLYVALGGGLTELASAYLQEPRIADRFTAVWIGGGEYPGSPPLPGPPWAEYNLGIDIPAAQTVFDAPIRLWQVPRDTYRQCLVSMSELDERVGSLGALGERLVASLDAALDWFRRNGDNWGETYILGDNPLVLLTALQSTFAADPSSSPSRTVPRRRITADGWYGEETGGPPVRVFTGIDNRLMFEDMIAKLARRSRALTAGP
jgi:purine nucleosidase